MDASRSRWRATTKCRSSSFRWTNRADFRGILRGEGTYTRVHDVRLLRLAAYKSSIQAKTRAPFGRLPQYEEKHPMSDDIEIDLDDLKRRMDGAMAALRTEFASLRTGRASASMLEPIRWRPMAR
jgi:hypothetical protein